MPLAGSPDGQICLWLYRHQMPRLPDEYLEFIIYLYSSPADAERGEDKGGTGFLVTTPPTRSDKSPALFAVTNAHVIEDRFCVIAVNKVGGGRAILALRPEHWIRHPDGDDVAVSLLTVDEGPYRIKAMGMDEWFLTDSRMKNLNVGPGDEVVVPGRFRSHPGKEENLPIVRFGHIAMMPIEAVRNERLGKDQESFLIEAHSLSGFSGSPVFVHVPPGDERWRRESAPEGGFYLMGLDWGHFPDLDNPKQNSGIMAVVPVWKLKELLEHPSVLRKREAIDA